MQRMTKAKTKKQFEYKVIKATCPPKEHSQQVYKSCKEEEKEGWQLVEVTREGHPTYAQIEGIEEVLMVFQREIA